MWVYSLECGHFYQSKEKLELGSIVWCSYCQALQTIVAVDHPVRRYANE